MKIELRLPPDHTFLSQVMYEGVLYLIDRAPPGGTFSLSEVSLPQGSLCNAFASIDERVGEISIVFTGNDKIEKLLDSIELRERPEKKTYRELLRLLKDRCGDASLMERSSISLRMKGKNMVMDRDVVAAPQLFKVDRYTGISSGEMPFTSEQVGLRASPEAVLIGLLGIYSSHITTVRQQNNAYHYFVFLSPAEVVNILASGDRELLRNTHSVKEHLRNILSETLRSSTLSEIMVLEVMLSSKIRAELNKANLDKVDFTIFKISPEGQTYKIYETLPLTVYARPLFYEKLKESVRQPDKVCEVLQKATSPGGYLMKSLASFNSKNKLDEADKVLNGVLSLYRFVTLADPQHLAQFLRCMREACDVLRDKKGASQRIREYERIQRELSYFL